MTESRGPGRRNRSEFQHAVSRLEKAVHDLVGSATHEFSDRTTAFLDETTAKLESEFSKQRRNAYDGDEYTDDVALEHDSGDEGMGPYRPAAAARRMRNRRRARRGSQINQIRQRYRSRRLYRDPAHAKIGGVCAGIANYYGMETWVVRCIAVTGLVFLQSIAFFGYWIAYFVMDNPPKGQPDAGKVPRTQHARTDHSSPAPELGMRLSPRRSLRNVQADLSEAELRLRRMESHVTSGQYELQKELNQIDQEVPVDREVPVAPSSGSPNG